MTETPEPGSRFNLSALAVREQSITLFFIIAIILAGTVAFLKLGRAEDPAFTIKIMTVVTAWPGATAQEMQDQVAEPLEKRLQELRWYDRSETFTRPGLAFTTLTLRDNAPPSEVQSEFYQARKKIADEAPRLPRGVAGPFVNDEYSDVTFALYALKAKGEPQRHLARAAEELRQRLLHVPGVKKVNIVGEQPERIYVEFSPERLATLGIAPRAIFAALAQQNMITPAGAIEANGPQIQVRLDGAFDDLEKIGSLPIVAQGRTFRLSDVAAVRRGYEDPATFLIRSEGEPALLLGVVMREGWNGLDLGKSLKSEVASISSELPLGMSLTPVTDQAVNIASAVDQFMKTFLEALGIVMVVSLIALGWRVGIVVATAVPLTLAIVLVIMWATDRVLDRITLGSLILALGLLVDDAIIAIEIMVVRMEEGFDRIKASAYAWSHTAAPMLAGTLVTVIGLMPVGFARSTAGEYAGNIFWVVGYALIASWIVAVVFTPYMGVKLLPMIKKVEGGHEAIYQTPRYQKARAIVRWAVERNRLVTAATLAAFLVAGAGMIFVKKQFFPASDRPEVLVEVQMPKGTAIERTDATTKTVEAWLRKQPEAKVITAYVGQGAPRFFMSLSPELPDPSFAKIVVRTGSEDERDALKVRLRGAVAEGLAPAAQVRAAQLVFGPYSPYPVAFRVAGPDTAKLRAIADQVKDILAKDPMMRTVNADWGERVPVLHLKLDQDRLRALGFTSADVGEQLQFLLGGPRGYSRRRRRRPLAGIGAPRPRPRRGFHAGRRERRAHLARSGRQARGPDGRADPPSPRPRSHDHRARRYRRRLAASRCIAGDVREAPAGHRHAAARLSHRHGGLDRGSGQGQCGARSDLPDHDPPDDGRHHPAGAAILGDGDRAVDRAARTGRGRADAARHRPAVRVQRHPGLDRTRRYPDAQHLDPDRTDTG